MYVHFLVSKASATACRTRGVELLLQTGKLQWSLQMLACCNFVVAALLPAALPQAQLCVAQLPADLLS
jgi:hypothetical protein